MNNKAIITIEEVECDDSLRILVEFEPALNKDFDNVPGSHLMAMQLLNSIKDDPFLDVERMN
jgi:hypothetical protein